MNEYQNWYSSYNTSSDIFSQWGNCGCSVLDLYKDRNRMLKKNKPICYLMIPNRFKWILSQNLLFANVCEANHQKRKWWGLFIILQMFESKENVPFILLAPTPPHKQPTFSPCSLEAMQKQVHRTHCSDYLRFVSVTYKNDLKKKNVRVGVVAHW